MKLRDLLCVLVTSMFVHVGSVHAQVDGARVAYDLSARLVHNDAHNQLNQVYVAGYDFHKIISSDTADIATVTFQPYLTYIDFESSQFPAAFSDQQDAELIWRITNVNFHLMPNRQLNLKVGHFEVPFGLEYFHDSNGTIRQFQNIAQGRKADWGLSINGNQLWFEYELSLTTGFGNKLKTEKDNYLFAGHISSPVHKNFIWGISAVEGKLLNSVQQPESREFVGLDMTYYHNNWAWLFELTTGQIADVDTTTALLELDWQNPLETLTLYSQVKYVHKDTEQWSSDPKVSLGIKWLEQKLSLSSELSYSDDDKTVLIVQARYRFE